MKSITQATPPRRGIVHFIREIAVVSLMVSFAHAEPQVPHWSTLRRESEFKELKATDKVAFVCTTCKTISPIPIQSAKQASKMGKDGENVTCPTCHMITKVIVRASRKDLYAPPVVTFLNDKGEEVAFIVKMARSE